MNNGVHQNKTLRSEKATGNSAPEETQREMVKKKHLLTSNGKDNGHSLAGPSRKRTRSTNPYDDRKRGCTGATSSECESLANIEESIDECQQSFESYEQQQSQQNTTSLIDASLVSPHGEGNGYTVHDVAGTNGTSVISSRGTSNGVTKRLTSDGYTVNGNGVGTLETTSPVQEVKVIDFRSDTCSLPTEGMRDAIYQAEVGDNVYGEDPTVQALEKKSAKLFQKEAACFVPSGTMSNLVAILVHCNKRGSEIITGSRSHILLFEQAGVAQFGGINIREIENKPDGTFSLDELKTKIREEDAHTPYTSLICVENTHNVLGGKVLPQKWVEELCAFAKSVNLPVHMDGARIFSASAKLNIPVCEITRNVDTVTFCISKNLGAPYGAVLLGSKEFIKKARRVIKALGGGVRQIGFMAAAGLYALENMVERISDDHHHVQMIANAIRELNSPHVKVLAPDDIHTNILMIRISSSKVTPKEFMTMLSTIYDDEKDPVMIKSFALDKESVRFVLCCNNSKSDVEDAIRKVRFVVNKIDEL